MATPTMMPALLCLTSASAGRVRLVVGDGAVSERLIGCCKAVEGLPVLDDISLTINIHVSVIIRSLSIKLRLLPVATVFEVVGLGVNETLLAV